MCSYYFMQSMENYQGDLADIVRASGGGGGGSGSSSNIIEPMADNWRFPSDPMNFPCGIEEPTDDFGDPFSTMRDPLIHELDVTGSSFFSTSNSTEIIKSGDFVDDTSGTYGCAGGGGGGINLAHKILDDEMKRPCNIFSRMLQISPNAKLPILPIDSPVLTASNSPRGIKTTSSSFGSNDMINANSSKVCLVDNTSCVQISSPRNPGIKRRKSQAKKVVCIPAPAPANSRPSGEIVPSDLWAWRKYGQKPIKGSPYPRGYYRCSSSKGCSARKQVERSRADPNMLVITYTSEHNHPWPTQRNALAGSTRAQPSKSNATASKTSSSTNSQLQKSTNSLNEEPNENNMSPSINVKEEIGDIEKELEMDDGDQFSEGFPQSYKPAMPDVSNQNEDFFADLAEIEADPLNLLFNQGIITGDEERESKALDPFSIFDWSGNNSNTSFGEEVKRGL
nr:WRKY [Loropetalum chinense var. rubrum]